MTGKKIHKVYKWELLVLLWLAYFFNQADRQLFSIVLPLIKKELHFSDAQLGLIASVLIWTYGCLVPVAGFIGDRFPRKKILVFSLLFWSMATVFTGLCSTVLQFICLRGIATGGGEAMYAPSANSLISTHHTNTRSMALAIHQTAVYAGIILSGLLAGWMADQVGWRGVFYVFGTVGVLLAFVMFKRLQAEPLITPGEGLSWFSQLTSIVKLKGFILLTLGFACMVFVNVGYLNWMPSLLAEKFQFGLAAAGFSSMFYHHAGAFAGVIIGGIVTDKLAKHNAIWRPGIQALGLLLGAPFIYWTGAAATPVATYAALFFFGIFRGIYDANIFASLFEIVDEKLRATASGAMLMFAFLIGACSPYLLGLLKPMLGLEKAMSGMYVSYLFGALFIGVFVIHLYKKKTQTIQI